MSALAQPVPMTTAAHRAIKDEVLEPALQQASAADLPALASLASAWRQGVTEGSRTTVYLARPQAVALAGLLDANPELARLLAEG